MAKLTSIDITYTCPETQVGIREHRDEQFGLNDVLLDENDCETCGYCSFRVFVNCSDCKERHLITLYSYSNG